MQDLHACWISEVHLLLILILTADQHSMIKQTMWYKIPTESTDGALNTS